MFVSKIPTLVRELAPTGRSITDLCLIDYPEGPVSEERLRHSLVSRNPALAGRVNALLELSGNMLPYSDAVVVSYLNEPNAIEAFQHTQVHMGEGRQRSWNSAMSLGAEDIDKKVPSKGTSRALGICSVCRMSDGQTKHIPMMDFRCSSNPNAFTRSLDLVEELVRRIGESAGAIFNSGASFHYYGLRLMSEVEWQAFLGKCLLMAPLTDSRYIGHRLIEGFGVLRIAPSDWKQYSPYLVAVL